MMIPITVAQNGDEHRGPIALYDFAPFCCAHVLARGKSPAGMLYHCNAGFNAPYSMMLLEIEAASMYDTAAENQGKTFTSTELASGGDSGSASTIAITKKGLCNVYVMPVLLRGNSK